MKQKTFSIWNEQPWQNYPPKCWCCNKHPKFKQLTCNNYDCAIELLLEISKKLTDVKHSKNRVYTKSISYYNDIFTFTLSNCISHLIKKLHLKSTGSCSCCHKKVPNEFLVCRNVKCISKFISKYVSIYKKYRMKNKVKALQKLCDEYPNPSNNSYSPIPEEVKEYIELIDYENPYLVYKIEDYPY
jgi:hypothetical protein